MLSSFLRLQLSIYLGCCRGCLYSKHSQFWKEVLDVGTNGTQRNCPAIPAAAAGSADADFLEVSSGLRVRTVSGCRDEGERERRSNRERRGSGSVWSKRERLGRRSSSPMLGLLRRIEYQKRWPCSDRWIKVNRSRLVREDGSFRQRGFNHDNEG